MRYRTAHADTVTVVFDRKPHRPWCVLDTKHREVIVVSRHENEGQALRRCHVLNVEAMETQQRLF